MRVLLATTSPPGDRKALAAARSLAAAGIEVAVGGDRFLGQAFHSRAVARRIRYPHPVADEEGFAAALAARLAVERFDVLLPTDDDATLAVARHRERFERHAALAVADPSALETTRDKLRTLEVARAAGIATPATWAVEGSVDVERLAASLPYPCVLKLRHGTGAIGLRFAGSPAELIRAHSSLPPHLGEVSSQAIVQEFVAGALHDACVLFDRGRPVAALTQERLRTYPAAGGVGILNRTTDEPELRDRAIDLMAALRWHGPAQVEFKVDPAGGEPVLMEVNGRFWGTLDLAIHAGVDFPRLTCAVALGEPILAPPAYEVDLTYRWPFPFALLEVLRANGLPAARELLRGGPRTRSDLRLSDPLPPLVEASGMVWRLVVRRLQPSARARFATTW